MGRKTHNKQKNGKGVTRETVIIAGLICFILGYATHGLVISFRNFGRTPAAATQQIRPDIFTAGPAQSNAPQPRQADDAALLERVGENPRDTAAWIQLGNLYFDTDNYEKAISAYNKALGLDPENPDVTTDLGIMYRRTGDLAKAIQSFKRAQEIDPAHQMSQYNMGIVFFYDMKNVDGALQAWNALLRSNPDFIMPGGQRLFDFLKTLN